MFTMEKGSSNTVTVPPADVEELPQNNPALRPRAKSITGSRSKPRRSTSNPPSPLKVNGVVQLELSDAMEQQIRDDNRDGQSYETHSDISEGDVILEGTDDGEEEEDEEDEGDSDVEFDEEVLKKIYSSTDWHTHPSGSNSALKGTNLAQLFNHDDDEEEGEDEGKEYTLSSPVKSGRIGDDNEEGDDQSFPPPVEKNSSMAGLGLSGEEGKALRALINPRQDLTQMSRDAEKEMNSEKRLTFGPGAAQYHPWSSRVDAGINSRLENEKRGDDIYFVGIIDILQQYNASKRAETFFKVHHSLFLLPSLTHFSLSLFSLSLSPSLSLSLSHTHFSVFLSLPLSRAVTGFHE
jgi:hypothetical protein